MGKTYFIDVDGTIVGYLTNSLLDQILDMEARGFVLGSETLLPGVKHLWSTFESDDIIVITTARKESHRVYTERIFTENNLRYNVMLMDLANGPRILINDYKDILIPKAIAINVKRNDGFHFALEK